MDQKIMEQTNIKKSRTSRGFSKEELEEYKAVMKSESSGGMSVYDYYYLDQDDI